MNNPTANITYNDLAAMARKALELQTLYLHTDQVMLYHKCSIIWNRLAHAMMNHLRRGVI